MSESRRTLQCLACRKVLWTDYPGPDSCPECGHAWRVDGVAKGAIVLGAPYETSDGASILKDS